MNNRPLDVRAPTLTVVHSYVPAVNCGPRGPFVGPVAYRGSGYLWAVLMFPVVRWWQWDRGPLRRFAIDQ